MSSQQVTVLQVLFLTARGVSPTAGRVHWLAMEEARRLFQPEGAQHTLLADGDGDAVSVRTSVQTRVLAPPVLPNVPREAHCEVGLAAEGLVDEVLEDVPMSRVGCDHRMLAANVRRLIGLDADRTLVVVTDLLIAPPSSWRYAVWLPVSGGAVLSTGTLDPNYWPARVPLSEHDRLLSLKRRARAASATVLGSLLGLYRCGTPTCFMFADMDSVNRLDDMVALCSAHAVPELVGRGFADDDGPTEPVRVTRQALQ